MPSTVDIHGYCDPRFSGVRDAFARNFADGLELGATCAATIEGEYVIDLWAGYADGARMTPWEQHTITNVYSTTKVMTALCALLLIDRGRLDPDAPVAEYWPEFAQGGKDKILVRWLLSHSAGLSGFSEPLPGEALFDWNLITGILARQEPWWEPGTRPGYHMVTFGYLVGELVRRISGKTLGAFFRDEVALPLEADFHIGLPEEHDARVAEMISSPVPASLLSIDPQSIAGRTMFNPPLVPAYSDRAWRAAEIPSSNGHGNARSAAKVGSLLACGGTLGGLRILSEGTIERALEEQYNDIDLVLCHPIRWGLGFGLANAWRPYLGPRAFYWGGFGGSWLEMDPDSRTCFSYVMNRLEADSEADQRMLGLRSAFFSALGRKQ
jgi:CubicO group peptidase (beta-lactamase class C family)